MSRTSHNDGYTDPLEPISVVEDLDPEPPGNSAKWRVLEMVLGLALVLGILTWGLGTWWQEESNSNHYDQGKLAATEHRWDDAFADFSAASGYKDSDALAEDAARQVRERDRQYDVALAYRETGPAAVVLQAARAVETIQPGYKDVDDLAARAEDQVYTDALSGTVVMRTLAQPPGLYYRGPGGWHYLQDSDRSSSVLSSPLSDAAQKYIVYDVPGPGRTTSTPTAVPLPSGDTYWVPEGMPDKAGRRLMLATLSGGADAPSYRSLNLDPAEYNSYVCNAAGVWGVRYDLKGSYSAGLLVVKGGFDYASEIAFEPVGPQAAGQEASRDVVMPGTNGMVVDFGHRSDMLLMAANGPSVDNKTNSVLYAARGDGSQARAVYWTSGTLVSASLSPDDRYALVVVAGAPQDIVGKETVSAILLSLDGIANGPPAPPLTLQEISMDGINTVAGVRPVLVNQLTISGVFLEKGAFENKLLLGWYDGQSATSAKIRVVDVSRPGVALFESSVAYADQGYLPVIEQDDGRTMLLFDQGVRPTGAADKPQSVDLNMLRADTRTDGPVATTTVTAGSYRLPVPRGNVKYGDIRYLSNPTLRDDNLIYQTEIVDESSGQMSHNAYSIPVDAARDQQGTSIQPVPLFNSVLPAGPPGWIDDARSGIAGTEAYAYIDAQGTLHARPYDADVDVPLEKGVGPVVQLNANTYEKSLR